MSDYRLFGWRVRSALTLPDLLPWHGDDRAPDVTVEIAPVPPVDPRHPPFSPAIQITPAGVRVAIPAVATYWVEAGRTVIVQPVLPDDAPDIRVFLLGTVLAVLCFQRGLLPLHAGAVEIGGRALLLSGPSGAGKSTLAAALVARGHRFLSDDLCALELRDGRLPRIMPAFPRVKLWHDSAMQLAVPVDGIERSRDALAKYHVPIAAARFQPESLAPTLILFLHADRVTETHAARVMGGLEALRRYDLVHRWRLGLAMGHQALMFAGMARLIESTPAVELTRSDRLDDLPALADAACALLNAPHR